MERIKDAKYVVIGGGHGLSSMLRGLKRYTDKITAVVTMADNGGSSGALRRDFGALPPGDIRACLAALSADEELLAHVLQYRFPSSSDLAGHNLGNLLLTAMANITGSFEQAIQELGKILAVRGKVTPSTLEDVNLAAKICCTGANGERTCESIFGESQITAKGGHVESIWIEPENVNANPEAIHAILSADLILLGPGSIYTSILPNLMVKGIAQSIKAANAPLFYICNVSSQPGETDGMNCSDHIQIIQNAIPDSPISAILCNNFHDIKLREGISWVKIDDALYSNYTVFAGNLVDTQFPWRHDASKLAKMAVESFTTFSATA